MSSVADSTGDCQDDIDRLIDDGGPIHIMRSEPDNDKAHRIEVAALYDKLRYARLEGYQEGWQDHQEANNIDTSIIARLRARIRELENELSGGYG